MDPESFAAPVGKGRGRGRRVQKVGTEEEQARVAAAAPYIEFLGSELSNSPAEASGEGEAADESKSTGNSSGGKGVLVDRRVRRGRGRGCPIQPSCSSSDLSTKSYDLSLDEKLDHMSVTVQMKVV
jgi:hypothetical protein